MGRQRTTHVIFTAANSTGSGNQMKMGGMVYPGIEVSLNRFIGRIVFKASRRRTAVSDWSAANSSSNGLFPVSLINEEDSANVVQGDAGLSYTATESSVRGYGVSMNQVVAFNAVIASISNGTVSINAFSTRLRSN